MNSFIALFSLNFAWKITFIWMPQQSRAKKMSKANNITSMEYKMSYSDALSCSSIEVMKKSLFYMPVFLNPICCCCFSLSSSSVFLCVFFFFFVFFFTSTYFYLTNCFGASMWNQAHVRSPTWLSPNHFNNIAHIFRYLYMDIHIFIYLYINICQAITLQMIITWDL